MKKGYPRIIIAGLKGGSGKTTLTIGLIAHWRQKGLKVIPFKKGPDYIDGGWLSTASENPCYTLDSFLIGEENVIPSFLRHIEDADIAVIEGNRGLYDGMDEKGIYSTAEIAKKVKSPVILIIDCTKSTRTVSAMVFGMQRFDPLVEIKGVVLNHIAGSRHESVIKASIERYCNVPVLGAFPKLKEENFPERHMGLVPFQEHVEAQKAVSSALKLAEKYLDMDAILRIANEAMPLDGVLKSSRGEGVKGLSELEPLAKGVRLKIGIIRDSAFQFYYPENLEELQDRGAEIIDISALKEKALPDIDALYIGGGFPETNAIALAENIDFRNSLFNAVEKGLPVYAECGGLMYLGKSLILKDKEYPMTGIFPISFALEKRPQAHGYSIVETQRDNPYYAKGTVIKGHEFHYSCVNNPDAVSEFKKKDIYFAFKMNRGEGIIDGMDGLCYKNVLATYTHIHALGTPEWTEGMIRRAEKFRLGNL